MSAEDNKAAVTSESGAGKKKRDDVPPRAQGDRAERYKRAETDPRYDNRAMTTGAIKK